MYVYIYHIQHTIQFQIITQVEQRKILTKLPTLAHTNLVKCSNLTLPRTGQAHILCLILYPLRISLGSCLRSHPPTKPGKLLRVYWSPCIANLFFLRSLLSLSFDL